MINFSQFYPLKSSNVQPLNKKNNSKSEQKPIAAIFFGAKIPNFVKSIEVEVNTHCNNQGKCAYCPTIFEKKLVPQKIISMDLFKKILADLRAIDFDGDFAFHRYNEPLTISVEEFIKTTKKMLPDAKTKLFTNGILLNAERLKRLQNSGIDFIIMTQHNATGFFDRLKDIPNELLKNVYTRYSSELTLSNRGGALEHIESKIKNVQEIPCSYGLNTMAIDVKGEVIPCVDDYYKVNSMGNIKDQTIEEIWYSPRYREFQQHMKDGERAKEKLCASCNRIGGNNPTILPQHSAEYRKKLILEKGDAHLPD